MRRGSQVWRNEGSIKQRYRAAALMNCRVFDPCILYELMKNDPYNPT